MYRKNLGLSLIELLVSMLIASVIFAGVVSVLQVTNTSNITEEESSYMQENARYALEVMARDIRVAGNMGCAGQTAFISNAIDGDIGGLLDVTGIIGFEGSTGIGSDWPAAYSADATAGSDSIILRYADPDSEISIQNHTNYTSAVFQLYDDHPWDPGDKLMVVDSTCRHVGIFEVTGNTSNPLNHNTGSGSPGNCTRVLFNTVSTPISCGGSAPSASCNPTRCNVTTPSGTVTVNAAPFGDGASVMSMIANAYYIGESNVLPGTPALMRQALSAGGDGHRAEELAQGVEDLELLYGEDTDATADGVPNRFVDAATVSNWDQVVAVRISMVMRSKSALLGAGEIITFNGEEYTDGFMRQLVTSTFKLRNR